MPLHLRVVLLHEGEGVLQRVEGVARVQRVRTSTAFEIGQTSLQSLEHLGVRHARREQLRHALLAALVLGPQAPKLFEPLEADDAGGGRQSLFEPEEEEVLPDADAQLLQL